MNVSKYLAAQYRNPPCWALVAHVQADECGVGPLPLYAPSADTVHAVAGVFRRALHDGDHGFARVAEPRDYCVVLMARRERAMPHHCGVFYQGRVLHALPAGAVYQDLASLSDMYAKIEFWARP